MLHQRTLDHVRQRQVRQHARIRVLRDALQAGGHRGHEVAESVHHALGRAGRARGVHDGGQVVGRAHRLASQGRGLGDDVLPARVALLRVGLGQRVVDAGQPLGDARLHAQPAVELADEQQLGLAVLEDLADGAGGQRRVQRHRDRAGHPDGVVGHHPVRRVLRQHGHLVAGADALRLQVGGHAARLVDHLLPRVVHGLAAAHRLREGHAVGCGALPVVQALQRQLVGGNSGGHGGCVRWEQTT